MAEEKNTVRKKGAHLTDALKEEIAEMWRQGYTLAEIQRELNVSWGTARKYSIDAGVVPYADQKRFEIEKKIMAWYEWFEEEWELTCAPFRAASRRKRGIA